MADDIFWGNLLGLLKKGKWYLSLEESSAFIQVYQEAVTRSKPPLVSDLSPITKQKIKKEKVKK